MKGQKTGGKVKGSKNRATVEREAAARAEITRQVELAIKERMEAITAAGGLEAVRAKEAADAAAAVASGARLAKDVLKQFMGVFAGMAAYYQPIPEGMPIPPNRQPDPDKFRMWATLATTTAKDLAPYESPRLAAVMVGGAIVNEIEIVGGLPDDEDGGFVNAPEGGRTIDLAAEPVVLQPGEDGAGVAGAGADQGADRGAVVSPGAGEAVPGAGEAEGGAVR